jgi:predicted aspartyl protease
MGLFTEEITLENSLDRGFADHGYLEESQIRSLTVKAMPDTGSWTLVINEDMRQKLGLVIRGSTISTLADGKASSYPVTQAVKIQWKNRSTELPAVVVADAKYALLGALPLEAMDLIVDPVRGQLTGAHGDEPLHILC